MGGFFDNATPSEHILLKLTQPPTSDELPGRMWCPSKHDTFKIYFSMKQEKIPFYVCELCMTVYRYQECTLAPGDEGHP